MSFELDLRAFVEKAKGNADQVVKKVGTDMLAKIVERSPVGHPELWKSPPPPGYVGGRFRGNWQVTFGAPATAEVNRIDAEGGSTKAAGAAVLAAYQSGINSIWLTNTVPYAMALEFGHSIRQAPQGMARVTAAEFQQFVNNAVRELDR
ncbi:hypothetical protein [Azotobacter beijerinckii]|uniref:Phage protein, HK97 gp10 family n=1 Tax=Azotobacter beijerinckii TaxID=170623 RepID=A0A1I0Z3X0_9GAMM|nr:hypothetical protein [Azotobacter beijerinckii]SFB19128.1 hypothetical protein SAMN04244571_01722 [Azotobacter beijerinckii]